ncbi:MAG TPA: histidine kinase [Burkholderiales bacterium]|nr:histidine kinase [Burkholderiales bacterium]
MYRRYAEWLVSISWKRFIVLSIVLLIVAGILSELPPFTWDLVEPKVVKSQGARSSRDVNVTVDENGVRITPKRKRSKAPEIVIDENGVQIRRPGEEIIIDQHGVQRRSGPAQPVPPKPPAPPRLPKDEEDAQAIAEQQRELTQDTDSLAQEIRREIVGAMAEMGDRERIVHVRLGDYLPQLAFLFILLSAAIKIAYARTVKAEAQAAEAHHVAEEEGLKRQLAEAKMAAMQAQIEPHFLFNTLASIDHLIETDPPRASQMQKNLIALLRASMPAMRDRVTSLGRELDVVRPYLEILKVRMGERLQTQLNVPEGLYSADFPPMMLQSLVENAIKHGLEPKAEGGTLTVSAEVVHGKLAVAVADAGIGFARAATAGTGMGLQNIRERLKLIYGDAAELRIAENTPSGTRVSIVVPYKATT